MNRRSGTSTRGRRRTLPFVAAVVVLAAAALGLFPQAGGASEPGAPPSTDPCPSVDALCPSTTTTTSTSTTTSTTTAPRPSTTTTSTTTVVRTTSTTRPPADSTAPPATGGGGGQPPADPAPAGPTSPEADAAAPVPAELFALPAVVIAAGPRSTVAVIDGLAHLALSPAVLARLLAPFPVAGPARYGEDFQEQRELPTPHLHQGTDIAAAQGTPVVASATGTVELIATDPEGGNGIALHGSDGILYYYAHLEGFATGLTNGANVDRGDIIGTVGTTGFSTGPHLHFEIHPGGGAAVDPVPYLDRWLAQASAMARAMGAPQDDLFGALFGRSPAPVAGSLVAGPGQRGFSVGYSNAAPAGSSHGLRAISSASSVSSMSVLAVVLTVLGWVVLRRRQRRGLVAELAAAARRTVPPGFDPSDPLWAPRKEVGARENEAF